MSSHFRCVFATMPPDDKPFVAEVDLSVMQDVFTRYYDDGFRLVESHDLYGLNMTLLVFKRETDDAADIK